MEELISSLLQTDMIVLDPEIEFPEPPENPAKMEDHLWTCKSQVLHTVVEVLGRSGNVRNESKLFKDLLNREKKATTAVGEGLAIPHVRTKQPRQLVMCFLRFTEGVEFMSLDAEPVRYMFGIITPPYADKEYFDVLTWIGRVYSDCFWLKDSLLAAQDPAEIRNIFVNLGKEYS